MASDQAIRILLAEDEMLIRELAAEDFADVGFDVVATASGDEALAILEADGNFQLLFTDIRMPGRIDGIDLARRGKAIVPGLRVIYATGYEDTRIELSSRERGIRKPYEFGQVLELMRTLGVA